MRRKDLNKKRKKLEENLQKMLLQKEVLEEKIRKTKELITEEMNTEIHEMVHAYQITPEQLAELLKTMKHGNFSESNRGGEKQ